MSSSSLLLPGWALTNPGLGSPHAQTPKLYKHIHNLTAFTKIPLTGPNLLHQLYHLSAFDKLRWYLPSLAPLLEDWNTRAQRS